MTDSAVRDARSPVVVYGVGQVGGVFARGLLRLGRPVVPIVRHTDVEAVHRDLPQPTLVVIAVAEKDLSPVLSRLPAGWRDRLGLVQNELLPRDWQVHDVRAPTVTSVWFEKRSTFEARMLRSSPVYGPRAPLVVDALGEMSLAAHVVPTEHALLLELVVKNVYILAKNAAGLDVGGTGRDLWRSNADLAEQLIAEATDLQLALTGADLSRSAIASAVREGFDGGPDQQNRGRTAEARVRRAVTSADRYRLAVPHLRRIARSSQAGAGQGQAAP